MSPEERAPFWEVVAAARNLVRVRRSPLSTTAVSEHVSAWDRLSLALDPAEDVLLALDRADA